MEEEGQSRKGNNLQPYSIFTLPCSTASLNRIVRNRPSITGAHVYELVLYVWLAATTRLASRMLCTLAFLRHARLPAPVPQPTSVEKRS